MSQSAVRTFCFAVFCLVVATAAHGQQSTIGEGAVQPTSGLGLHGGLFYAINPRIRIHGIASHLSRDHSEDRRNVALGVTYQFVPR